jgi:hypothetical protein
VPPLLCLYIRFLSELFAFWHGSDHLLRGKTELRIVQGIQP